MLFWGRDFNMKTRIITGVVAIALFLPFMIFSGSAAYIVFTELALIISAFEMVGCMHQRSKLYVLIPAEIYVILSGLATRLSSNFCETFMILTVLLALWLVGFSMFSKGSYPLTDALTVLFGVTYVALGFCSIVLVRDLEHGAFLFWLIFIAAWLSDTGAYFVGVRFGTHKLCPDLSPKKTVEGLLGGVVSCVAMFVIYGLIITLATKDKVANIFALLLAGIVLSLISVFGDLLASYIKRRYKVKDYGSLLPGHGGLLDRFDSVIAVSIAMFAFCRLLKFMPLFSIV